MTEPTIHQLFDLHGKNALVTGATGRLGRSIAWALVEAGARVVVTSRDQERASIVAAELCERESQSHIGLSLDHLDAASIHDCFSTAVRHCGGIDILVNNAHEHTLSDLTNCKADDFNRQLGNATGYFLLSRMLRDDAVRRGSAASIIMLGSMYGIVASYPDVYENLATASPVAYQALKGGVLQMTRHLAVYWAKDRVRVNAISPGPFPGSDTPTEMISGLSARLPMGRMGQPHELKGAVVFLASDASSFVTGHNLVVDGGWTAW